MDYNYLCIIRLKNRLDMSEKGMQSYRLTSTEEPTDEMLAQLMKEAAEDAKKKSDEAHRKFFQDINDDINSRLAAWSRTYNVSFGK